jgi:MinD-like ATPase involved in chromosome partitioning or flagellar assembly/DNA-binding response OmpR family regulator
MGRSGAKFIDIFKMSQHRQVQDPLLAYVRHELCTPIDAMIGYSAMLLFDLQTQPEPNLIADLQKIHSCSHQLSTLVAATLDPVQPEPSQIEGNLSRFGAELRMELITPLSTIVGYCEMLLEEAPADLIPDLDRINASAQQLLGLINDIVYLAQQQLQTSTALESSPLLLLEPPATAMTIRSATAAIEMLDRGASAQQVGDGAILVVDDNSSNCELIARQLTKQGYTVATATNAQQALRLLTAVPCDLILLDVVMPEVNGLELLQQLKQHEHFQHIPAIAISALKTIDGALKCMELGAADYLAKPCDPILMHCRITACLEQKRLRDREVRYRQQIDLLTAAAAAIETKTFDPQSLDDLSQQPHELGQLFRVFQRMAQGVNTREQFLEQQIHQLQATIDEGQRQRWGAESTATERFQPLQQPTKHGSDLENLYRSSLYPSLHPAPPQIDRPLSFVATRSIDPVAKMVNQPPIDISSNIGTAQIVTIHSCRGGTGKSSLTSSLAVSMANQGQRVGVIDLDLQSPGLHVMFGLDDRTLDRTLNDYLWGRCALREAVYDLTHILPQPADRLPDDGALYLIPASPKVNDIQRIFREDYDRERLRADCVQIASDLQLDVLLIDTHPDLNPETLQAMVTHSLLVMVLRPDNRDYQGTAALVELARTLSISELLLIINQALPSVDVQTCRQQLQTTCNVPIAAALPFSARMMALASSQVFAVRYPTHPLTQAIAQIGKQIIDRRGNSSRSMTPDRAEQY